ncbi:hypothetical protein FACS1894178_0900 [Bacteroidia bacterium]|nr:hypothetical protein FACS1894178_0900 [Bacteroidia bacterium]
MKPIKLITLCILHFAFCININAQTTKLEYKVQHGKVYEDGSHVDFIEMAIPLSTEEQDIVLSVIDKHSQILSLKFYEDKPNRIRFKAVADFTADEVVAFIESKIKKQESRQSNNIETGDYRPTGCTNGMQYPSSTVTPMCVGSAENITTLGYAGEYSVVAVTSGVEYLFTSSISSYFITIATNVTSPVVLASGTASVVWTSTLTGTIRFYTHTNSSCGTATTRMTRSVTCGTPPPPPINNFCNVATALPCETSNLAGSTVGASANTGIVSTYASPYGVWYSFVGDGQYTTISSTANFDHELVILSGSCRSLAMIADIDLSIGTETYSFITTVGTTYYVYIAHFSTSSSASSTGYFTISRTCSAPPPGITDFCSAAEPFCDAEGFTLPLNSDGGYNDGDLGRIACCSNTPYPMFYFMGVAQSGSINIYMESPTGNDIDFVAWGPFASIDEACGNLQLSCNGCGDNTYDDSYPYGLVVDCSYSFWEYETCHIPNAIQGEIYVLLVTNYEEEPGTIAFEVTQQSTSEIDCSFLYSQLQSNSPLCAGSRLILQASNQNATEYYWYGPDSFADTTTSPYYFISNIQQAQEGTYYLCVSDSSGNVSNPFSTEVVVNIPSDTTYLIDSILSSNSPYMLYGFNADTAGIYFIKPANMHGCDSVVRLELYFQTFDTVLICNTELPYLYRDSILEDRGSYTFQDGYNIHTLELQVVNVADVRATLQSSICADDGFFSIYFEPDEEEYDILPANYDIVFGEKALNAGFVNQKGNFADEIQVPFPDTVYPDHYAFSISVYDSSSPCAVQIIDSMVFAVYYPTMVMEQKWDNTIFLKNYAFNGGYYFAGYQWYRNGEILTGETNSILHLKDSILVSGDFYYVDITRNDGSTMLSCPYIATAAPATVSAFPTVVQTRNQLVISNTQNVKATRLYTVTGALLQDIQIQKPIHTLHLTSNTAYYLLEIVLDNGHRKVFSFAVN